MDWDKLRIFHAAAQAGSFTHAGDKLHMSQSAISRQVSALEHEVGVPLFHRHARGLILTEQGETLYRTAHEVLVKLESVQAHLTDSRNKPTGTLRVTTTIGLGSTWLAARLNEFIELYPDLQIDLMLEDQELDLAMREADVAIRLRKPTQPDLIQRRLFTVHFHLFASPAYINQFGHPDKVSDLDDHRIITFGERAPGYLKEINWLETAGRSASNPRLSTLKISNILAIKRAALKGIGVAILPDYLIDSDSGLVQIDLDANLPSFDTYFVYPEELKKSARVSVFRDFLISKAKTWRF
ncbi:LysR family transcriptional regulator [Coralliovum pocilloporae]|uniref:LysR family transcriptional regulator n=1 Tax=Coralliovum pocilloporae TaxID=3066369 RepID=UPI0033073846